MGEIKLKKVDAYKTISNSFKKKNGVWESVTPWKKKNSVWYQFAFDALSFYLGYGSDGIAKLDSNKNIEWIYQPDPGKNSDIRDLSVEPTGSVAYARVGAIGSPRAGKVLPDGNSSITLVDYRDCLSVASINGEVLYISNTLDRVSKYDGNTAVREWVYSEDGSVAVVRNDVDEYVYIGGSPNYLRKIDPDKNVVWSRYLTTDIKDIALDADKNVYAIDDSRNLAKYSVNASQIFNKILPYWPRKLAVDANRNIYVVGNGFVAKLDSNGDEIWFFEVDSIANSVFVSVEGFIYVTLSSGKLMEVNSNGNIIFEEKIIDTVDLRDCVVFPGLYGAYPEKYKEV